MSTRNKNIIFNPIGWIVGGFLGILAIMYFLSLKSPVQVLHPELVHNEPIAYVGEAYTICRNVEYIRDSSITLQRVLLKNLTNGVEYNIDLSTIRITRSAGEYNICRAVPLPSFMEEGSWTISTYIGWNYLLFSHVVKVKDIDVMVYDRRK